MAAARPGQSVTATLRQALDTVRHQHVTLDPAALDNRAYEFEPDLSRRSLADVAADFSEAIGARSAMMDRMVPTLTATEPYPSTASR